MANNKERKSLNLLPAFFRTDKNSKFLSNTIDQLIKTPSLERIDGFVGSKLVRTYDPVNDFYITETLPLREKYQLEPALVIKEPDLSVKKALGYDDLINQLTYHGAETDNLDDLFSPKFYSFNSQVDWDKLVNFKEYYWLPTGPTAVVITKDSFFNIEKEIIGQSTYVSDLNILFVNGLKVRFEGDIYPTKYKDNDFIVEGVGDSIKLVNFKDLKSTDLMSTLYNTSFDGTPFDKFPFDNFTDVPLIPEYITINRSSIDKNSWTRYNRWFHRDVIQTSADANGVEAVFDNTLRATRPIIEFKPNIQLFNFASYSAGSVNYIDEVTPDAFSMAEGSVGYVIDGNQVQDGDRVVFSADKDPLVRDKIFEVNIAVINGKEKIDLVEFATVSPGGGVYVTNGDTRRASEWWFDGLEWKFSQQRVALNQHPLFDLFDNSGVSYSSGPTSGFIGNKIFNYALGLGTNDPVLGFPLKYRNVGVEGTYLFQNYFESDAITITDNGVITSVPSSDTYFKVNDSFGSYKLSNIWDEAVDYKIPVLQFQLITTATNRVELTVFDSPAVIQDLRLDVFVDDAKKIYGIDNDYKLTAENKRLFVDFNYNLEAPPAKKVLIKCYTDTAPNASGVYETPLNLTNNPLNENLYDFTLTELSDHVKTMINREPEFQGEFPGISNLKSLPFISKYGTQLIKNKNPLTFSQCFIADSEHNSINAIRKASTDYYQFKLNLIRTIADQDNQDSSEAIIDRVIATITQNKNNSYAYGLSDMLGYGDNKLIRTYTVDDVRNTNYPIASQFSLSSLSNRSVLVYLNGLLLLAGKDYVFEKFDSSVTIIDGLTRGDTITIVDYLSTVGSYIPPTPTKLGLYPRYEPKIYVDYNYAQGATKVIQGHDGSITVAFTAYNEDNDYRDLALLEYEKRVYNNIKVEYNHELIDHHSILPGVFRKSQKSYAEILSVIEGDFLKWTSTYNIDFSTNSSYDVDNHKTYNFKSATDAILNSPLPGSWRAIYRYYFDTDRPNTHPWEMLGFGEEPLWWKSEYGPAPYTAGNMLLWNDLEQGLIRQGSRAGIDSIYSRPGLSQVIPVDDSGNIIDIREWAGISLNESIDNPDQSWSFGDCGPAETAWRNSSIWPFMVQIISILNKPATYSALMFDTSRLEKNAVGQYSYGPDHIFLNPSKLYFYSDLDSTGNFVLAAGYSVYVIEYGKNKNSSYLDLLKQDLANVSVNLFYKAGGFLSKDKLSIAINAINPTTSNPGVYISDEDYTLFYNVSNPVKTVSISGIIVEKKDGKFYVKGYDKAYPFFNVHKPIYKSTGPAVTVGGRSEPYLDWTEPTADNTNGRYYSAGQIVKYQDKFYRVIRSHYTGGTFITANYAVLSSLPIIGGASVLAPFEFETETTAIPYGISYTTLQEVYDLIVGYGNWLESQGFVFDKYNQDLFQTLDWKFSGKEFLYWTTQNWANGAIITLSPFADYLKFVSTQSVVDNLLNNFYDYSLLRADGTSFPYKNFSLNRQDEDGSCVITTKSTTDGMFFARLNLVQKEHTIIFNNVSLFNDTIYDTATGYRQGRVRLTGFKTSGWDGNLYSPGFVYDEAQIDDWQPYIDYPVAKTVRYSGNYYTANQSVKGSETFNFNQWTVLGKKPIAELLPNFDYKINQFEDFYSLEIDNFDSGQQKMAQHLTGYTPRVYLDNIFANPIAQYKFYQGFIKEKGTKNAIDKLTRATLQNLHGQITYNEEWAFKIGNYGSYTSYNEVEFPLKEADFRDNSQIVKFVDTNPYLPNDPLSYITPEEVVIKSDKYQSNQVFDTVTTTYNDDNFSLPVAGYARLDDVTATAFNQNSLLDVANNSGLKEGNTVWLGFRDDGQWDVYRYTLQKFKIISSAVLIPTVSLIFNTDEFHRLSVGDVVSIYGSDNGIDGIYQVKDIPSLSQFTVDSKLGSLSSQTIPALTYKFVSVRVSDFDELDDLQKIVTFKDSDLVWSDNDGVNKWTVYKKQKTYSSTATEFFAVSDYRNQKFATNILSSENTNIVLVSIPNFRSKSEGHGRVSAYRITNSGIDNLYNFGPNTYAGENYPGDSPTGFGKSLAYDVNHSLIFVGAPSASNILTDQANYSDNIKEGFVKVLALNPDLGGEPLEIILSPNRQSYGKFGFDIFLADTDSLNANGRILLISAPGENSNSGVVYPYAFTDTLGTVSIQSFAAPIVPSGISQDLAGSSITGKSDGELIAISAPGTNNETGAVYVYSLNTTTYSLAQSVITAPAVCKAGDKFGHKILMTKDGSYLFASSITVSTATSKPGKVFVYKWINDQFTLIQTLDNPAIEKDINFGFDLKIDDIAQTLVITGKGNNQGVDQFLELGTTFDGENLNFVTPKNQTGSVYTYIRYNSKFIFSEELLDLTNVDDGSEYGQSIGLFDGKILVGAPKSHNQGGIFVYNKINNFVGWDVFRQQDDSVDMSKIQRAVTIDSQTQQIVDYLDILDPVKGHILGIADREIKYKTAFDPAIYSVGNSGVAVDTNTSWIDEHVGELWWDLSSVKYVWYEQGDLQFRKNSWGTLFPAASIDVYEWVKSEYLPSQWSSIADTNNGLSQGISGQPKYPDNSVISVQQYYNPTTGSTTNVYYYWVKNKATLPNSKERQLSSSEVARLIYDPASLGTKYISIIAPNAIVATNISHALIEDRIYLNIAKDDINNTVNKHTEWLLITEGVADSMPNTLLNKKLIDSLIGKDSLGNQVPDPALPDRIKYGLEIRPRQGMFKDRFEALRNLLEYTNTVLKQYQICNIASFSKLNTEEEIPDIILGLYDKIVENNDELMFVQTDKLVRAKLSCKVTNGRLTRVIIDESGYGYINAPSVQVLGDNSGAKIVTKIDEQGRVIDAQIIDAGMNFVSAPELQVRPFTVIIQVDSDSYNYWSTQEYDNGSWFKVHTQSYNTKNYWHYIDWTSIDYDSIKPLFATVDEPYQLAALSPSLGDYIKVKNQGNGKYLILKKVSKNGTFNNDYDVVYSEKGTIQINNDIYLNSNYNYDYKYAYAKTLYDQSPDTELSYILLALRDDIFIGELKVYWNKFFFKAVKYALSEQIFLDWAFKTSFINVKNLAGILDQRPVYKFQNSQYYEDYLHEVKPYHTQIRNFQTVYKVPDISTAYTTDFDLPAVYNTTTGVFQPLELNDPILNTYPYKSWYDNYKYHVGSIVVVYGGRDYDSIPEVRITAQEGDTGFGATAVAYLSLGQVYEIEVIDAGENYTQTPSVEFIGNCTEPAQAYVRLENGKVRTIDTGLKFDRISSNREIGQRRTTDQFICPGNTNEFVLTFAAENKKDAVELSLDDITVLSNDFNLESYTELFNDYHKKYSKIVLNFVPTQDQVLKINYNKSIDLYHAVDRIEDFYQPTSGMPGKDPEQLMSGVEYAGTKIDTLPFAYSAGYDSVPLEDSAWDDVGNSDQDLDSVISGGNFNYDINLGLNPEDIILEGDKFLSPNIGHAPEELLPGKVRETVAISVYTAAPQGGPLVMQSTIDITTTTTSTTAILGMMPPSKDSVMVSFNNQIMDYGVDYKLDIAAKTITINTQSSTGLVGVTIVGVGGSKFLSYGSSTSNNLTTISVESDAIFSDVGSVYVTLNGESLTSSTYILSQVSGYNKHAQVTVNNLITGTNTLQAWFFASDYKGFSEVKEQIIVVNSNTSSFVLNYFPGNIGPAHAQAIVELNKKRLVPPNTVYYSVDGIETEYDIDPNNVHPAGIFNLANIEVHKNGVKLKAGVQYYLTSGATQKIKFYPQILSSGDVIAISNFIDCQYKIESGSIIINGSVSLSLGDTIKVISFTNHDSSLIRTEVFSARANRRYPISRNYTNDNYVWVSVGGNSLVNGYDYYIDGYTVVLSDEIAFNAEEKVTIMSLTNTLANEVIAYKIFKDILNRTSYHRLSELSSTRLGAPLYTTSTVIEVEDASVLPVPNSTKKHPAVIFIDGERIEYMEVSANSLKRIKRATLGTGAKAVYPAETTVESFGRGQSVPYKDTTNKLVITATNTASYLINEITFDPLSLLSDQIEVYYGGIPLQKPTAIGVDRVRHDVNITYDSGEFDSFGNDGDIILDPEFDVIEDNGDKILVLNIPEVKPGVLITVIQRTGKDWYSGSGSLLTDTSVQAKFLQEQEATLPDKYHYGQL